MTGKPLVDQPTNWPTRKVGTLMIVLVVLEIGERAGLEITDEMMEVIVDFAQIVIAGATAWLVQNRKT